MHQSSTTRTLDPLAGMYHRTFGVSPVLINDCTIWVYYLVANSVQSDQSLYVLQVRYWAMEQSI